MHGTQGHSYFRAMGTSLVSNLIEVRNRESLTTSNGTPERLACESSCWSSKRAVLNFSGYQGQLTPRRDIKRARTSTESTTNLCMSVSQDQS
jgi:hypothetical protein